MRKWLPSVLAFALLINWLPSASLGAGSLAARVQAARSAQQQQSYPQVAATTKTASPATAPSATMPSAIVPSAIVPPSTVPSTTEQPDTASGRINVADWLNGTPESATSEQPVVTQTEPEPELEDETLHVASARRTSGSRAPVVRNVHSPARTPAAAEPAASAPVRPDLNPAAVPSELVPPTNGASNADATHDDRSLDLQETEDKAEDETEDAPKSTESQGAATAERRADEKELSDESSVEPPDEPADELSDETMKADESVEITPSVPKKEFSPQMLRLRDRIRSCLAHYYQYPENVSERSPWGVMHALISYGVDTEIQTGRQRVNAIGWLCYNRPCRGMKLFKFDGRYPVPQNGPGYQGHEGQFLSMLALSRVKPTYPIQVDGHALTVQDLIEYEKITCQPKSELTFKLIALAHYLPSDATWTSKWGQQWDVPRLIAEELAQPINGACCGGTHRLIGYSMAVKVRQKRDEPLDGQWLRAYKYVDSYHKYVVKLQNRDGSFSTDWLKSRDASGDLDRRVQTTGHILEWLVFSLPDNELTDPRVISAVNFLTNSLLNYRQKDWEIGPRGHALRAIALYNERVFGDMPGQRRDLLARRPQR